MTRIIPATAILLILCAFASAQEIKKCYQLGGLKNEETVYLTISGRNVSGEYVITPGYESAMLERYSFTGIKTGNTLIVKFADGKVPQALPAKMKNYNWTMASTATREFLRLLLYGKNYQTNKYGNYYSEYDSCWPVYGALLKAARTVRFVKGKNSVNIPLNFKNTDKYKTFLINARKGQSLEINAPGSSIVAYLPDKTDYTYALNPALPDSLRSSHSVGIMNIEKLPQTGNYLVRLEEFEETDGQRNVSFKITGP